MLCCREVTLPLWNCLLWNIVEHGTCGLLWLAEGLGWVCGRVCEVGERSFLGFLSLPRMISCLVILTLSYAHALLLAKKSTLVLVCIIFSDDVYVSIAITTLMLLCFGKHIWIDILHHDCFLVCNLKVARLCTYLVYSTLSLSGLRLNPKDVYCVLFAGRFCVNMYCLCEMYATYAVFCVHAAC